MWDKFYRIRCDDCRRYCRVVDDRTVFGCADPEAPEPYDPEHFCKDCAHKLYLSFMEAFKRGSRSGDWIKSDAERWAAQESNLVWKGEGGYDIRTGAYVYHQYMHRDEVCFFLPHGEYEKARREQNRCRCGRVKVGDRTGFSKEQSCPDCTKHEIFCQCPYYFFLMPNV